MSNYYSKLYTQHHCKYEESIFDRIGGGFGFKSSKNSSIQPSDLSQVPTLVCDLVCKNLSTNETIDGVFSLHKNFLILHDSETLTQATRVLDISFSRMKAMSQFLKYKITLTKDQTSFELTLPDKNTWKIWASHFERSCILTDFEEKYEIIEVSEKGKHSNMYTVRGSEDKFYYSAKGFNKKELLCSKNSITQISLINQIETMRALNHRKIIQLIEIHETHDFIYLVTEYIHSRTLEKMLKNSRPSETNIKVIIFSLLRTLAYMASKGILHRNIKPSNILIDDEKKVKVAGFSLATYSNATKINFGTCGTPGYIAPEVLTYDEKKSHSFYDDKCDVFSAGCVFFQLLFGHQLFQGSKLSEIADSNRKVINFDIIELMRKELNSFSGNKQGLNLLLKLLERDPNKRISAQEALHHPYFNLTSNHFNDDSKEMTINSIDEDILDDGGFTKRQTKKITLESGEISSHRDSERSFSPLVRERIPSRHVTTLELSRSPSPARKSKFNTTEAQSSTLKIPVNMNSPDTDRHEEIKIPVMNPVKRSIGDLNLLKNNTMGSYTTQSTSHDESEVICDEDVRVHVQSRRFTNEFGSASPTRNGQTRSSNFRWS